jgi:hypothetical protein
MRAERAAGEGESPRTELVESPLTRIASAMESDLSPRAGRGGNCQRASREHPPSHVPGRETSVSLLVMNSKSTGMPAFVFSMPRLIAGTMSLGRMMRSP